MADDFEGPEHYEDRHRKLREAAAAGGSPFTDEAAAEAAEQAEDALRDFWDRTAELSDWAIRRARALMSYYDSGDGHLDWEKALTDDLRQALAALDEEALRR